MKYIARMLAAKEATKQANLKQEHEQAKTNKASIKTRK